MVWEIVLVQDGVTRPELLPDPGDGIVSGVGNMLAYGAGMALLVSALTIALASANTSLLKMLRTCD